MNTSVHNGDALKLIETLMSEWITQAIGAFTELGIADAFGTTPSTPADIAAAVGCDASAIRRLFRPLAGAGILSEEDSDKFQLTTMGKLLRQDHPRSLHGLARLQVESWIWRYFQLLPSAVRGPTARVAQNGSYWDYLKNNPAAQSVFNRGMAALAQNLQIPIALSYNYKAIRHITDIGGGVGELLAAVLEANPHLNGTLFELPATVTEARRRLDQLGVGSRCATVSGDMFTQIPGGADAYLLSSVLLDWNDEHVGVLLRNVAEALPQHGRVLIVDCVLDACAVEYAQQFGRLLDLFEMCAGDGQVRTLQEFADLADSAELTIAQVLQPQGSMSLLELVHRS